MIAFAAGFVVGVLAGLGVALWYLYSGHFH
jgi:hypothetical protein